MTTGRRSPSPVVRVAAGAWLVAATAAALLQLSTPRWDEKPGGFFVPRAMETLGWVAREPHPVGTAAHREVGRRIAEEFTRLGLSVETQDGAYIDSRPGNRFRIVQVRNVLAKLPGTSSTRSIVLMGHYDSAVGVPGAADDGAAVAVLLETARVLKADAPLANDVIFVATDAEEAGLCGARLFLAEHTWARGIGALLNFEARGLSGPSILFETGQRDGWLVRQFATAAAAPRASSLAPALYERMPNSTDLTVFRGTDVPRLNFAFAQGWQSYHTARDSAGAVDQDSVGHHGTYALSLARRLGSLDLRQASQHPSRLVYFTFGPVVVRYDERAALPIAAAVTILLCWYVWSCRREGRLRGWNVVVGSAAALACTALAFAVARGTWMGMLRLASDQRELWNQSRLYLAGFVVLTATVIFGACAILRRFVAVSALAMGAMVCFAMAGLVSAVLMPGASYVFAWPLAGAIAAAWGSEGMVEGGSRRLAAFSGGSLLALMTIVPTIWMIYLAMPTLAFLTVPWLGFAFMLLAPCAALVFSGPRIAPLAGLCITAALFGATIARANHAPSTPSPSLYVQSASVGRATWITRHPAAAGAGPRPIAAAEAAAVPSWYGPALRRAGGTAFDVPPLSLPGPSLTVEHEAVSGETRVLTLRLESRRRAPEAAACFRSTGGILRARSGARELQLGRPADPIPAARTQADRCDLVVAAMGDVAVPLTLEIPAAAAFDAEIVDVSYGLSGIEHWTTGTLPAALASAPGVVVMTTRVRPVPAAVASSRAGVIP